MSAQELHERLWAEYGVRIGVFDAQKFRAVTHIDISAADIEQALLGLSAVIDNERLLKTSRLGRGRHNTKK